MLAHAPVPAVALALNGDVLFWNDVMAEATRIPAQDIVQQSLRSVLDCSDSDVTSQIVQAASTAQDTTTWTHECRLVFRAFKPGFHAVMDFSLTIHQDHNGKPWGMAGIAKDMTGVLFLDTQRKRVLNAANAPGFELSVDLKVVILNRKALELIEYPMEEIKGVDFVSHLVAEDCREQVTAVMKRAVEDGQETPSYTFAVMTKTGRRVEMIMNATPRYNMYGDTIGIYGVGQDITERLVLEREYNHLIDTANAPMFALDKDLRIIMWNREAAAISEYTTEDAIGASIRIFSSNKYRDKLDEVLHKAMKGEQTANFELPWITKSGRKLDIVLNTAPRYDQCGHIVGVIGIGQDITDRRAQEHEYARLIDTANAPIFGVDIEGRVNIWNRKAALITEYSLFDVLGSNLVEEFIPADYQKKVGEVLSKATQGAETANFEFPIITPTGRRIEILLNATTRYDEKGDIIGVVGIGQDITVRIAQEQEYSRLIDTANAPIFGVDMGGLVNIWNKKAVEITQFTTEDVMGRDLVQEFISEEYRFAVGLVLSQALNGVQTANFNFPLITQSGRRVEILLNATPRYNELGEIVGVVGIGQDITDRIAQEQEYARLIDTANAPIFGVDEKGHVNIWNKKAADITQFTPSEVMGEHLVEKFITQDYKEAVGSVLSKALSGTEMANFEFPLITKSGRRVEILLNATPRYNEHGEVIGMVGIGQDITERIAQEQEYARLIEKANAPIFGVDRNGCVNIWNQKTADITQYTRAEVMGEKLVEKFISEEGRDVVATVLAKALKGNETSNFEAPFLTKMDRNVNFLLNATARFDQHGQIVGVVGIGQDLTDRIAQQEEYARLIDTANAPIFGVDRNLCVNIWNKKAAQITQYSTSEVMGENLVETFISPEYRPIVADVLSKALNGVQTANFEFPLITRPGTRIEILLNATPRMNVQGDIVGVVGIGQDITDRIAQEHEYFRLIDTANAPIFGVDTFGCINEWNQKIEEITGHHKSTVLGISLVDAFITEESRPLVRKLINQALIGIDVGEMELPMTTKSGRAILLLVNASSKKDMHGNIRGVIGVGQDYTAKKHMEAAKVTFLASFSHELRTPLNGVLGMLELLREQKLDQVTQRYVHMAFVSGSLLLNLINDILDLSKIEAGHLEISKDPFLMQDLLDYVIEIFNFKAREKGLTLALECSENVPKIVIGDVARLRQVLLNLLSNAMKFTTDGSITIKCSAVPSPKLPKSQVKLLFQVIDTGIGMDNEDTSRLFSLFTKLERTRKNNPTGSGLGLAICKQLVELMNGEIDVDSELGEGSEFFFTVVVERGDENAVIDPIPAETVANGSAIDVVPTQARILVVEDNEFNWEVVKCFFAEDNHLLQWEQNGRDAYMAYKEHHDLYDLVLMDCEMPIMNGYTATRSIRQFEKEHNLPRIPIIGLTAYAMSGDRKKCLDAGMDEFIVKPISKGGLRAAIRQWMCVRYLNQKTVCRELSALTEEIEHTDVNLVPAATHNEALDLIRAISDLELEDPMMIRRESGIPTSATEGIVPMPALRATKSAYSLTGTLSVSVGDQSDSESVNELSHERLNEFFTDSPHLKTVEESPPSLTSILPDELEDIEEKSSLSLTSGDIKEALSQSRRRFSIPDFEEEDSLVSDNQKHEEADAGAFASSPASFMSSMLPEEVVIPDGDPVNYTLGVDQCGGNENLFFSLLEKYASVIEEYMRRIEGAFISHDYVVLRREAHSLKGSSAYVAAMRMSKAAFRLQLASERVMERDIPTLEEATSLLNAYELLRKENRLVVGYLRRNFSFRRNSGNAHPELSRRGDEPNACVVM
ncbi:hypothetical protein Poli38472_005283 [Pythium oligandrum]|uniref:histidine kinase n=1 Tax=Pythium oligandrum TaxID=41045 RepID=A0A8K1CG98_PYTOL|nr:hypothetical protein Poli38472_005283 [Pythium oligandrum]|eukprot:TMW62665.1 hypothetical protein Poli38472_005283 [Pythium oligandrum]